MNISITEFKLHCLKIIRMVERDGASVAITRRGRVVVQLCPLDAQRVIAGDKPWERLRAGGGHLLAAPDESVLVDRSFEARRSRAVRKWKA